jgi:hypothetical protein
VKTIKNQIQKHSGPDTCCYSNVTVGWKFILHFGCFHKTQKMELPPDRFKPFRKLSESQVKRLRGKELCTGLSLQGWFHVLGGGAEA